MNTNRLKALFNRLSERQFLPFVTKLFNEFSKGQKRFYKMTGSNPIRDSAIGFIDSLEARLTLINEIKDNLPKNKSFIIALDAQNLGVLNEALGEDCANAVWRSYTSKYIEVLSQSFSNLDILAGFRGEGDEAQIVLSGKGIREKDIMRALQKADEAMKKSYELTGLCHLPSRDGLRASGFKLHYAVCAFFDFERQGITELQGDNERINDQARAFNAVKELAFVMTDLNTGKETSDTQNAQISTEEFRARYAPEVKQRLDEQQVQAPEFLVSQPFIAGLAQQRDAEVKAQKHKDFLASAPDNSLLIRFDMTGLRLLNKALSSVAVEAILGDIHSQVVAHAFRVASSTHGIGFLSHELRSGVIDVLVDPDEWRKYKSDVLDYADHCLGDLYKFHLDDEEIGLVALRAVNGDHSVQRDKSDSPQDSSSANKAENLLSQLEKQFRIVETPLDQGDLYASLSRVERLMGDLKARKDDVRHISPRHNAAKHIS